MKIFYIHISKEKSKFYEICKKKPKRNKQNVTVQNVFIILKIKIH
jgi:hypothetical protein